MIIQTGQRTDIPAFYSEWLVNRLREGFVMVRNPFEPRNVTRYVLDPSVVDVMGFCTKDPSPMLPKMDALRDYRTYWHVTITPYGRDVEPNVPGKDEVIRSFRTLSDMVGPERMAWRYDPILLNDTYDMSAHIREFTRMAGELEGYTKVCIISFLDLYDKVRENFPEARAVPKEARLELGKAMIEIAGERGMTLRPCAEGNELAAYGADCRGCMTQEIWQEAAGIRLRFPSRKNMRKDCQCFLSGDIGQYDTCGHMCRYCYANTSRERVLRNMRDHDPKSPLLVGHLMPEDTVHEAQASSWAVRQMDMFADI
ncbi:MAG: DUF1848 domain-containing protein [Clostridia bacterium]|nr:DUF1848 domain-containing protein [Clostridia bacterium]